MLHSEFTKLTGVHVTSDEYAKIEEKYMLSPESKDVFCGKWLKEYNNRKQAESAKFKKEHSIERLFSFMDGVASIGSDFCRSDLEHDKRYLERLVIDRDKPCILFWCVRETGTELLLDTEDYQRWNKQRGAYDFSQYKITSMSKGLFDIERIN